MSVALWSSILSLIGSILLVIPALRADQLLSSAHFAQDTLDTLKTLPREGLSNPGEHEKLTNTLNSMASELEGNAKKWTPTMSLILKAGVLVMVASGILRILASS